MSLSRTLVVSGPGKAKGSWCQVWGHSALTRTGDGRTKGERGAVDHGSKEARLEGQEDRR